MPECAKGVWRDGSWPSPEWNTPSLPVVRTCGVKLGMLPGGACLVQLHCLAGGRLSSARGVGHDLEAGRDGAARELAPIACLPKGASLP